jgi:uncharacterized protein DUF6129
MCISNEKMMEIQSTLIQFSEISTNPISILKECFPDLTFVRMSDDDMDEAPYVSMEAYNLYLLDGRDHCVQLTQNPAHATAVVVTQKAA